LTGLDGIETFTKNFERPVLPFCKNHLTGLDGIETKAKIMDIELAGTLNHLTGLDGIFKSSAKCKMNRSGNLYSLCILHCFSDDI